MRTGVTITWKTSAAVLLSGAAHTAKLFVATLAFTAAYVGFAAHDTPSATARGEQTVTLSARATPVTGPITGPGDERASGGITPAPPAR
ncbi:hypothetical protein MTP10_40310 [Nonomuraea sp. 3-1Str]|uniref:hypothetical protein n=1 Tax=Nonomuraea sp. 3-1Str TaxID=2929801 RepID=UPI002861113D|nr:hypothetical protein [Nonomuraea sp. 3-1Str]MDR8414961.1 hypothetical protein [Nonomuraea sp. 3-1Str]